MSRQIDHERHVRQRTTILRGAYLQFAAGGYERTSTAAICAAAGVSSGTLFHYFPTKLAILLALMDSSDASSETDLGRLDHSSRGLAAVIDHLRLVERRLATEHFRSFSDAVRGAAHLPAVAAAHGRETARVEAFLRARLREAADAREIRRDVRADQLAVWLVWLIDGATLRTRGDFHSPGDLERAASALLTSP